MSDIHADEPDEDGRVGSLFDVTIPENQVGQHPFAALQKLIADEGLSADVLVCSGDITNRAKPNPLQRTWPWLSRIKTALSARELIATVGNHDLDSRHDYNDHDARGMIQEAASDLPVDDPAAVDAFWARHMCCKNVDGITFVILNTCAFHAENEAERERGRVSTYTLRRLEQALEEAKTAQSLGPVNFLVCHHHPNRHPNISGDPDYHEMIRGAELLSMLGSGGFGEWMIIHGHKHIPAMYYAQGSTSSPIIFSAGSLSARLYDELQGRARNQFYILDVHLGLVADYGMVGTGRAWDFAAGAGWAPAERGSGLPREFGFGSRRKPKILASEIATIVDGKIMNWGDVVSAVPETQFVLPDDFESLRTVLAEAHGLRVLDSNGRPEQIGRVP